MKNVEMEVKDNILTMKIDLTKEFGPSSSGKTIIIATTEGNVSIPDHDDKKVGLNVYRKKQFQFLNKFQKPTSKVLQSDYE